ncbi:MAG: hypothetical protein HOV92_12600 [Streptomyces sp.]|nr:hypothetical protein [Streptomyces sp.]
MSTAQKAAQRRLENQARHYNSRQAEAVQRGPMDVVALWFDASRKVAKNALEDGDPAVANALASHLHDFFQRYTQ